MYSVNGSYFYYLFLHAYSTGLKYSQNVFIQEKYFHCIICIHSPICKSITASLSLSATTMLASRGLPCGPSVTWLGHNESVCVGFSRNRLSGRMWSEMEGGAGRPDCRVLGCGGQTQGNRRHSRGWRGSQDQGFFFAFTF